MEFVPVKKYKESFPQFGQLLDDDVVIPDNCEVTGIPAQSSVGKKVDFTIITKNHNNERCSKGGSHIVVQAQPSGGDVVPMDNNDGSYSAYFVTKQVGEVKLSITIEGNPVKGSPYIVVAYRDYKTPRKIVKSSGNFSNPIGIGFGKDGVWAVTNYKQHFVHVFDDQDKLIRTFGQHGTGSGQLNGPWGVSFDANNHLYVADHSNNRVQKFQIDGTYLLQFGQYGSNNGQLSCPCGVVVHNDKVFVADGNNCRVSVFHVNGQFSHIIGSGHLRNPYDVAVTGNDQLLVADYHNHCISRFTLDGTHVDKYGNGYLRNPAGVTTDFNGFILVMDNGNSCVSIFDKDGGFVRKFGSNGSAEGQFSSTHGIAVSPSNDVYVADYGNKRVQIF